MTEMINAKEALLVALNSVALSMGDVISSECRLEDELYEISLSTLFQHYDFYVDAVTAEVLGINSEPTACDSCEENDAVNFAA